MSLIWNVMMHSRYESHLLFASFSTFSAVHKQKGLTSDEIMKVEMPVGANDMGGRTIDQVIKDAGSDAMCNFKMLHLY